MIFTKRMLSKLSSKIVHMGEQNYGFDYRNKYFTVGLKEERLVGTDIIMMHFTINNKYVGAAIEINSWSPPERFSHFYYPCGIVWKRRQVYNILYHMVKDHKKALKNKRKCEKDINSFY